MDDYDPWKEPGSDPFDSPFSPLSNPDSADFKQSMAGYQPMQAHELPAPVWRLLQNQQATHFWRRRDVCVFDWLAPAPPDVRLILWNGRKAELIKNYQTAWHGRQTLFVFRRPPPLPERKHRGGVARSRYEQWEETLKQSQQQIEEGKPLSLAICRLGWDKNRFDLGQESLSGWVEVLRQEPHDGQRLEVVVKAASQACYREEYAHVKIRLRSDTTHYRFTLTDVDEAKVLNRKNGGLRFKAGLEGGHSVKGDHLFSGIAECVRSSKLTLVQFADQLRALEADQGYETARLAARQLDYRAMCDLVHARDLADNDPNLMPSRFMLLPGSSDEGLEAQGNLDPFPWPVHPDGPQHFSVAFLKYCLRLGGYLESDEPSPLWQSEEEERCDEFGHPLNAPAADPEVDTVNPTPNDDKAEFDDALLAAYRDFLDRTTPQAGGHTRRQPPKEKDKRYQVQPDDTLDGIAKQQGYRYWQALFTANADRLDNPDQLEPGQEIILPVLDTGALKNWLTEQNEVHLWWTGDGAEFPADYMTVTLENSQGQQPHGISDHFQAYRSTEEGPRLFYDWVLSTPSLQFMLPIGEDIGLTGFCVDPLQPRQPFNRVTASALAAIGLDNGEDAEPLTPMGLIPKDSEDDTENNRE